MGSAFITVFHTAIDAFVDLLAGAAVVDPHLCETSVPRCSAR